VSTLLFSVPCCRHNKEQTKCKICTALLLICTVVTASVPRVSSRTLISTTNVFFVAARVNFNFSVQGLCVVYRLRPYKYIPWSWQQKKPYIVLTVGISVCTTIQGCPNILNYCFIAHIYFQCYLNEFYRHIKRRNWKTLKLLVVYFYCLIVYVTLITEDVTG